MAGLSQNLLGSWEGRFNWGYDGRQGVGHEFRNFFATGGETQQIKRKDGTIIEYEYDPKKASLVR